MRAVTTYYSDDGKLFETPEACREYEASAFARKFVGLTLEQVQAAIDRTDISLADAFEQLGGKITAARREAGELRRRPKSDQVPVAGAPEEPTLPAASAADEPNPPVSTQQAAPAKQPASATYTKAQEHAYEAGRKAYRDGKAETVPGGIRQSEWDAWEAGYSLEAGRACENTLLDWEAA